MWGGNPRLTGHYVFIVLWKMAFLGHFHLPASLRRSRPSHPARHLRNWPSRSATFSPQLRPRSPACCACRLHEASAQKASVSFFFSPRPMEVLRKIGRAINRIGSQPRHRGAGREPSGTRNRPRWNRGREGRDGTRRDPRARSTQSSLTPDLHTQPMPTCRYPVPDAELK